MIATAIERIERRIVTYNVNSLVAALSRAEGPLLDFIERDMADIYALQEIMVDPSRPLKGKKWSITPFCQRMKELGYHSYWHPGLRSSGGCGGTLFSHW